MKASKFSEAQYEVSHGRVYKYKSKYSGVEASCAKKLKMLESNSAKLKKLLEEFMPDVVMLRDVNFK